MINSNCSSSCSSSINGNHNLNHNHDHKHHHHHPKHLPKRIILVRHGESQGNKDDAAYTVIPDHKIPLTSQGFEQAEVAGSRIRDVISDQGASRTWKVYFYVSPYERTRSTLREIGRAFPRKRVIGVREECRIREQDFGNFQIADRMKTIKETREKFGRFFFRFPEGESAADVFDRVSTQCLLCTPFTWPYCTYYVQFYDVRRFSESHSSAPCCHTMGDVVCDNLYLPKREG